jgi:hypothetical protein
VIRTFFFLTGIILILSAARAEELMVYPNAGQDDKTQSADEQACAEWAQEESGFDPGKVSNSGGAEKREAPATPDNTIIGEFRRAQELVDREEQILAKNSDGLDRYRRAFTACMEGRNYTVR